MAEYRITYWREIPSMVTARDGDETAKAGLPTRFQEAIDEAAMRQGMAGSDAYLEQWRHGDWQVGDGSPDQLVSQVAERIDAEYDAARLESMLEE
jgi:cvfA/B/C family virulence factor